MVKQVLLTICAICLLPGLPSVAQTQSEGNAGRSTKTTKLSATEFRELVRSSVKETCIKTAPIKDIESKEKSCDCYASAYEKRFSVKGLVKISNWLETNPNNAGIIPLMMNPEVVACGIIED